MYFYYFEIIFEEKLSLLKIYDKDEKRPIND